MGEYFGQLRRAAVSRGNEQGSHKYISELLGKATIDTNTYGRSSGRNGNYSTNYQITGRELMTPDEVRMLDNRKAILLSVGTPHDG